MAFRLKTLLDLKIRAEEAAEKAVALAIANRAKVERAQAALESAVVQARERLCVALEESSHAANQDQQDALSAQSHEHFRRRLRAAIELARENARNHRAGPLAAAMAAEATARAQHVVSRQEREALDKLKEKELAKERLIAERRNEDALGDLAIAAAAKKPR